MGGRYANTIPSPRYNLTTEKKYKKYTYIHTALH